MAFPKKVKIVEVGPRDGLQNEKKILPEQVKIDFINRLAETGLSAIEVTSFVSAKWIPQLADHQAVFQGIHKKSNVAYPVLVPNMIGFDRALACGAKEIAIFTTPSEQFSQHNTHCSVKESLAQVEKVMMAAKQHHMKVRGYLSCVLGCPYEGDIAPANVVALTKMLFDLGCYEISLGDTIGVGTAVKTRKLLELILMQVSANHLAVHFHDTFNQALVNIYVALEMGIAVIDSSVAGLGGCPYAVNAGGNVATEDVLYLLQGMNIETGVDLKKVVSIGRFITQQLGTTVRSKVNLALYSE